jgi:hypothetical protein
MKLKLVATITQKITLHLVFVVCGLCGFNLGCDQGAASIASITDPVEKIHSLEDENTRLQSENQTKSEQLAAHNAKLPGGLALGEREEQLAQWEARLTQLEQALVRRGAQLEETERTTESDFKRLGLAREEFLTGKEELLVQIGESKQMTEH